MSSSADELSPVKRALLELRNMRARLEASERTRTEPIAIVGMGVRLPGGIATCDEFWTLLSDGRDAITEVPIERWDAERFHDPDPDAPGKISTRFGGFLDRIDEFDARFFGITPREAASMDPQQRLLLEVAWEALEHAGQAPDGLAGEPVGVFVGLSSTDYLTTEVKFAGAADIDAYIATGGHPSVASGRLSYLLGLQGPSLTVDTACSSSLTAVHLAAQSLRLGECRMALAGGVSLLLLPELSINFSRAHMMAPDGRCKTFDARADGYVRSEGCGVLVLKRLSDAVAANDRILAVIRGSALNQDGRSSGLTVPNGPAQEAVIREALRRAGTAPADVDYVEAHGTGTSLGDPVELRALGSVFSAGREAGKKLTVGSVKTNLGHLEAAAGVAGIDKVVLALQHGVIPAHLNFQTPTPHVDWTALPLQVPSSAMAWARAERARVAGVSSFGFSGTNAHVVIAEAPPVEARAASGLERPLHLLTISGKTPDALRDAALGLSERALGAGDSLADICYTSNAGRAHFAERAAIVAASFEDVREGLAAVAAGTESPRVARGSLTAGRRPEMAFVFAGYGSQYVGMGRELFETNPAFRRTLLKCEELLRPHFERPLTGVLYPAAGESSPIDEPAYGQPALFAFEYALAELWRSWGVQPAFVLGHSLGEDAAACAAGVFDLEQGIEMVARRAEVMQQCMREGAMAAVFAQPDAVRSALEAHWPGISIAAINGPQHVVISGPREAVAAAVERFKEEGIKVRPVSAPRGCHSVLMDPVLDEFEALAAGMRLAEPRLGFVSTLTGRLTAAGELTDPRYWRRHVRETVRFSEGLDALYEQGVRILLEIGPRDTLTSMGRRALGAHDVTWVQSLGRSGADWAHLLPALSEVYVRGVPVRWDAFDAEYPRRKVQLPSYPFQRERHWSDAVRPRVPADARNDDVEPLAEWMHRLTWQAAPLDSQQARVPNATGQRALAIFGDDGGFGARLAEKLNAEGRRTFLLPASELIGRGPETDDGLVRRIAQRLREEATGGIDAVIHTGSLDAPDANGLGGDDLVRAVVDASGSLLHALQAIVAIGQAEAPRLWVVTRGAEPANSADVAIVQSPVIALAATIDSEHPELRCTCVDIDPQPGTDVDPVHQLWQELTANDGRERRVAWRAGRRSVARISKAPVPPAAPVAVREDATYIITGGAGALGLLAARWLADAGARHLVLTGRSGARGSAAAAVDAIRSTGCNVHVASGDAGDETFVGNLVAHVRETMPPLKGVIHAAGVLDDGVLLQQTAGRLAGVMRPKIGGAWNLHRATSELALDFFVFFSSAAALLGTAGQGNYAAANAFMDALADARRRT
jgi:acyl transferase domain-containing protein